MLSRRVLGRGRASSTMARMREIAIKALQRLGVTLDVDPPLKDYSIAQRQIVAIARALVGEAKLVFMDEPTASLTQSETDHLLEIVRTLSASGVAVVFVSHRLAEVLEISNRLTVLRDGALVGVYPVEGMTQSRITELMTGKTFDQHVARAKSVGDNPVVLEVKRLSRPGQFEDISFTVRRGETLGITGLLGAGRTELALALFGMLKPRSGSVMLEGKPVRFSSNRDAIAAGIAYLSEDRLSLGLIQPQSIADNLVIASLDRIKSRRAACPMTANGDLVARWIADLGVKIGRQGDAVSTLSGGNQQRIAIAKWLATDPKLLILDAPTVGVDVGARAGIFEIVAKLAESGLAIILISDEVPEVYFNADRVLHMAQGPHRRLVRSRGPALSRTSRPPSMRKLVQSHATEFALLAVIAAICIVLSFIDRQFLLARQCLRPAQHQFRQHHLRRRTARRADCRRHRHLLCGRGLGRSICHGPNARLDRWRRLDQRAPDRRRLGILARRDSTPS